MSELLCYSRKKMVLATPEENVRQRILQLMVERLDFPLEQIVVEKSLDFLPTLMKKKGLNRRADILCFQKNGGTLTPFLLVECKARVKLDQKVFSQAVGYNYFIKAPYLVLANEEEIKTIFFDEKEGGFVFVRGIPNYHSLIQGKNL